MLVKVITKRNGFLIESENNESPFKHFIKDIHKWAAYLFGIIFVIILSISIVWWLSEVLFINTCFKNWAYIFIPPNMYILKSIVKKYNAKRTLIGQGFILFYKQKYNAKVFFQKNSHFCFFHHLIHICTLICFHIFLKQILK